jgi:hypothetical protein
MFRLLVIRRCNSNLLGPLFKRDPGHNPELEHMDREIDSALQTYRKCEHIEWKGIDAKHRWELKAKIFAMILERDRKIGMPDGICYNSYAYWDVPQRIQDLTCSVKLD